MITGTQKLVQPSAWQTELAQAIDDPAELLGLVGLGQEFLPAAQTAARLFGLRVPRGYVRRMRRNDPNDPLLRQVLPLGEECIVTPGYSMDPVADDSAMVVPGVLHKYPGRVLLTVTGACAIHCRYCFRRYFPYHDANPGVDHWRAALDYIAGNDTLHEVILSGGDPLVLSDRRLAEFSAMLSDISHVKRLRLHTRLPVVLPERVSQELLDWIMAARLKVIVVIHANHANEIDIEVRQACASLRQAGITLLNQSVLLRGVNDRVTTLCSLSEALFEAGVLPYYLHVLDRVQGASHFEVDEATAVRLMTGMNTRLPGYLVPRLVREVPGMSGKMLLI